MPSPLRTSPITDAAKTLQENVFFHYDWQVRFVVDLGVFLSASSALLRRSGTGALLWHPSLSFPSVCCSPRRRGISHNARAKGTAEDDLGPSSQMKRN